jgi:hypothetical protein
VIAGRVGSVLPLLLKYGLVTAEEVDIGTLAQRLRDAAVAGASVVMAPDLVSAWTRTMRELSQAASVPFHLGVGQY